MYISYEKVLLLFIWSGILSCGLFASCMGDDDYIVSPTARLAFSADTVDLDTIISGQVTNTYTFQVFNHNEDAIRISQVYLEKGSDSLFRVNVDGTYLEGGSAMGFEIDGKDFIRVFLSAKTDETNMDAAVKNEDKLVFVTEGGMRQEVVLQAYGQDVIPLHEEVLTQDTEFSSRRPYQIFDSLVVAAGCTLTLKAGVRLYFHPDARLIVHGTLIADGEADGVVVFRGDRLGNMFSQQPYDRIPGQWGGVVFTRDSYGNRLNFCDIHSALFGLRCDSSDVDKETLSLENSIVHNMSGDVLTVRAARVFVGNSQLTNAGGNCVTLRGGHSTFVQCTIGNFYAFAGGRGVALDYSNIDGDVRLPLHKAAFQNCLITGYSADEIMGSRSDRYPDDAFEYLFQNCLLDTPEFEEAGKIIDCLWDNEDNDVCREKNFSPEFDLKTLLFTFGLDRRSQAVDHADAGIAARYPYALNGVSRLADGKPDIGCYECTESAIVRHMYKR